MDVDENEDMVIIMEGILNTMVSIIVIHQILKKRKPYWTTKSGVILR